MENLHPVEPVPASPLRILVVEDDPESLNLMGALLSLWGHEPRLTDNGFAGIAAAAAEMPDVVLLDLGLPGMDGFEVAGRLRALPGGDSVLVVAVTAFRCESYREHAMESGFDRYLMKPVDIETLRTVLTQAPRGDGAALGRAAQASA